MTFTSTLKKKFNNHLSKKKVLITIAMWLLVICFAIPSYAGEKDSLNDKRPVIVTNLDQCRIPQSMVLRIRHLSSKEMQQLNEEYQQTDLTEEGFEIVTTVKLRFIDDHITGYIKEASVTSGQQLSIRYIDIPVEWMCIPPQQDHPFHFATSISELDSIKLENGCLDWVQRDNEVVINFATEKPKKKNKSRNSPKTK